MTVSQLQKKIGLKALNGIHDKEIAGAYVSDMLSDVMAGAKPGNIWVTIQIHKNIVAVANLVDVSAVIIAGGRVPQKDTLELAEKAKITVFSTDLNTFKLVGKLHQAGVTTE
jgi:predicted transcriptional regulator